MNSKSLFLFFLITSGLLFSQTENEDASQANCYAIQFQVQENFKLTSFAGSTISLKRNLSETNSIRVGIGLYSDIGDRNEESKFYSSSISQNNISQDISDFGLNLTALYLWNSIRKSHVSFYYGIGPSISYSYFKNQNRNENINSISVETYENTLTQNVFGFGVTGVLGIEWYVKDNISLLGEYGIYSGYSISKQKTENYQSVSSTRTTGDVDTNGFTLQSLGVKLGISVYL